MGAVRRGRLGGWELVLKGSLCCGGKAAGATSGFGEEGQWVGGGGEGNWPHAYSAACHDVVRGLLPVEALDDQAAHAGGAPAFPYWGAQS